MRALTPILLLASMLASVLAMPVEANAPTSCVGSGRASRAVVGCDSRQDPPPPPPPGATDQGATRGPSTPMMWIRFGVYSAGDGFVSETCRLWPVDQPLPANHARATGEECGVESARPSREDVERMVHSLAASLKVPTPTVQMGPEPSVNVWNMSVVGLPIWLWTDAPRDATSSNTGGGMRIDITAHLDRLTFDMGDGQQVACTRWTPYTPAHAGEPSPTCGHVYAKPSSPRGEYTITATASWTAQWSAMGHSGTLPLRSTASRSVPVGELQAVVVRDR